APAVAPAASAEPTEPRYAATQVLITYHGAAGAPASVTRTTAEAYDLAVDVWRQATTGGVALEDLARTRSDGPTAPRGGRVGAYAPGTMVPAFERAVAAVPVGGITAPFETPFGWHVVRRDAVVEVEVRQIVVGWQGAWKSASTRTRDQAKARIDALAAQLAAGGDFAALARSSSEDPSASVGGALGPVARGQLIPAFEEAAFALRPGERSVVESPYGFHLIERTR
ncbi:MAG: peptidylprolyl isomerase, partial [Myxococcota bacterium]